MKKIYRVCSGITMNQYALSIYSLIDRHPKHVIPVFDKNAEYDVFFWTDDNIFYCNVYDEKNYGWLTESEAIVPDMYQRIEGNLQIAENFVSIFTHKRELVSRSDKFKWIPASSVWIKDTAIHDKTKLVSMITSTKQMCAGHLKRLSYLEKFKDKVEVFGNGIRPIATKEEGLNDYMFSVAIENAEYSGYFTEKILDCFATGTVPIYLGDPDVGMVFNTDGIIFLNKDFDIESLTPELYYSKMDAIRDNFNRVHDFFTIEDYIYHNYWKTNADKF